MAKSAESLGTVMNPEPAWVAKVSEPALEPDLPIVDPHHHLWDHPGSRYQLDELMADFRTNPPKEMNGSEVVKIVDVKNSTVTHVQTGQVEKLEMDKSNVMQFYLADGSKISARPSGTEPKIKYYFSVNSPITDPKDYREVEAKLVEKLEGLRAYFS